MLDQDLAWVTAHPNMARVLSSLIDHRATLVRTFDRIDGKAHPAGREGRVVDRWLGTLIVYIAIDNLHLSVKPSWVTFHGDDEEKEEKTKAFISYAASRDSEGGPGQ